MNYSMCPMVLIALLDAMAMVESGNNPKAYNAREDAVGAYQVRKPVVKDLNRVYGTKHKLKEFYSRVLSRWAVVSYARIYGWKQPEEIARCWNGGPDGPTEPETRDYWKRVRAIMEAELKLKSN